MKLAICRNCGVRFWSRSVPSGIGQGIWLSDDHKPCVKNPKRGPRVRAEKKERER